MMILVRSLSVIACFLLIQPATAQRSSSRPWNNPRVPIVIDPYYANAIDWKKAASDPRLKAVIHKASEGLTTDPLFLARAQEARARGLLYGAYHLGRPGDPIQQAELLLRQSAQVDARFLAIDIEGDDPSQFMSLEDAQRFMEHVASRTGRYPAVYVNFAVYRAISQKYDRNSIFGKGPLWIARFGPELGLNSKRVWDDYTFWQFSSEINCRAGRPCPYRVPGTATDMDINVFRGDAALLRTYFQ